MQITIDTHLNIRKKRLAKELEKLNKRKNYLEHEILRLSDSSNCPVCQSPTRNIEYQNGKVLRECTNICCSTNVKPKENHISRSFPKEYFEAGQKLMEEKRKAYERRKN